MYVYIDVCYAYVICMYILMYVCIDVLIVWYAYAYDEDEGCVHESYIKLYIILWIVWVFWKFWIDRIVWIVLIYRIVWKFWIVFILWRLEIVVKFVKF